MQNLGPSSHELPIRVCENTGGLSPVTWPGGQPMGAGGLTGLGVGPAGGTAAAPAACLAGTDWDGVKPNTRDNNNQG